MFNRAFSQDGNRSIKFRVAGGEYCSVQVLKVESDAAKIEAATLSLGKLSIVEKADGEIITAVVTCNDKTGIAELYVGNHYDSSSEYVVQNGQRLFTLQITLGGNNKSYAGNYTVVVRALKGAYEKEYSEAPFGTLTVKHDTTTQRESAGSYYKYSAEGHTLCQKTLVTTKCKICNYEVSQIDEVATSREENHVDLDINRKCSVCGFEKSSLIINDDAAIDANGRMKISSKSETIKPHYYLDAGSVSGDASVLEKVIRQFDVTKNYMPDGNTTYCNFYAGNVARAMGAFLPGAGDTDLPKLLRNCDYI